MSVRFTPRPARTPTHLPAILALGLLIALVAGCATTPAVGVRSEFRGRTVVRVAVAPLIADSHFGLPDDAWRAIELVLIRETTGRLEELGFVVVPTEALRDTMERASAWDRFHQLVEPGPALAARFEPNLYAPATPEIVTLRELSAAGLVHAEAILFAELVYHSAGECDVDPRAHSRFAAVVDTAGQPIDAPRPGPCIVTHVEAKLVDAKTAGTMWQNRALREVRADVTPEHELANVKATTDQVIAGPHGLGPFAPH